MRRLTVAIAISTRYGHASGRRNPGPHAFARGGGGPWSAGSRPISPPPLLIRPDGPQEIDLPEPRPVHVHEIQLRVRELPKEEVRDPLLPARPEHKVGVREVPRVQALREELLVDLVRAHPALLRIDDELSDRVEDLLAGAVRYGEVEEVIVVVLRPLLRVRDRLPDERRQEGEVPEDVDLDLVSVDTLVVPDLPEVLREQPHELLDLFRRPAQVLRGERVHGEDPDADVEAPLEDLLQLVASLRVAHPGVPEAELLREPAVAVHDDRDVLRDRRVPHLSEQAPLVRLVRCIADDPRDIRRHPVDRLIP